MIPRSYRGRPGCRARAARFQTSELGRKLGTEPESDGFSELPFPLLKVKLKSVRYEDNQESRRRLDPETVRSGSHSPGRTARRGKIGQ